MKVTIPLAVLSDDVGDAVHEAAAKGLKGGDANAKFIERYTAAEIAVKSLLTAKFGKAAIGDYSPVLVVDTDAKTVEIAKEPRVRAKKAATAKAK